MKCPRCHSDKLTIETTRTTIEITLDIPDKPKSGHMTRTTVATVFVCHTCHHSGRITADAGQSEHSSDRIDDQAETPIIQ